MKNVHAHIGAAYREVRLALLSWNWDDAEQAFHSFCERYREHIPDWYEDEIVFTGMKLWSQDRPQQVLRHFALFFDRAAGREHFFSDEDVEPLRQAQELIAA